MRRSRRITRAEQWDIALMLALLTVGLLCLTVLWRTNSLTRIFAFAASHNPTQLPSTPSLTQTPTPATPLSLSSPITPQLLPSIPSNFQVSDIQFTSSPTAPILPTSQKSPLLKPTATHTDFKFYNGQKYRFLKTIHMRVTAYSPDERCCWPYPGTTTASGLSVRTNKGKLVAADTRLVPFNSLVSIPGYHNAETVPVLDRGQAIKGNRLDVLMPTFAQAQNWGARLTEVKIYIPTTDE